MSDHDIELREETLRLMQTFLRASYLARMFTQLSRNLYFETLNPCYLAGRIPFTLNLKGMPFEMDVFWGKN